MSKDFTITMTDHATLKRALIPLIVGLGIKPQ